MVPKYKTNNTLFRILILLTILPYYYFSIGFFNKHALIQRTIPKSVVSGGDIVELEMVFVLWLLGNPSKKF